MAFNSVFRKPQNYEEFKDLIARNCGYPVLELEIDPQQIDDAIFTAYKKFVDYHYEGTERTYYSYALTQTDIDRKFIILSEDIVGITNVWEMDINSIANSIFGIRYQWALNDLFNMTSASLTPFQITMQHLSLIQEMFSTRPGIRFNKHMNKLQLDVEWKSMTPGRFIVFEVYRAVDPLEYPNIWSDSWLTKYSTELVKKQIGYHLMKFNITLLGGVTYNGSEIFNNASEALSRLDEELYSNFSTPPLDFIG